MVKLLHWCALRISDLGEVIFNLGGNLEFWCDSITYERERRARVAQWQRWVDEYAGKDVTKELNDAR